MGWQARSKSNQRHHPRQARTPMAARPGMGAVVSNDRATYPWFASSLARLASPAGTVLRWKCASGGEVARGRNQLVDSALDFGAQWIFFLDDDHVLPSD